MKNRGSDEFELRYKKVKKSSFATREENGSVFISVNPGSDIWDGSDCARLHQLLEEFHAGAKKVIVNMSNVKSLPRGTFGLLADYAERQTPLYLTTPTAEVAELIWFQHFTTPHFAGLFQMHAQPVRDFIYTYEISDVRPHTTTS